MYYPFKLSSKQMLEKRILDIVGTIILLPLILLLMSAISIVIIISEGFPIIIKQERLTYKGKKFYIYKFRTMLQDAEKNGPQLSFHGDERITATGRFLRRTNLDELPQFFNVLKGDMSIIGPRPEREYLVNKYIEKLPEFNYRLGVKAGITGIAQTKGSYDSSPSQKLEWDLLYIENYSIANDISIIIYTACFMFEKLFISEVREQELSK